jgi:excisionase family DNA binding protein
MPDDFSPTEWLTTAEAAELTGYSVQYIRRLIGKGRVVAKKWGRDWFLNKASLLAYQKEMEQLGPTRYNPWRTGARRKDDGAE